MLDRIAIFLVEEADGNVAVQLLADLAGAKASFDNLDGDDGPQCPKRATLVQIDYAAKQVTTFSKVLPVEHPPPEDGPDGYVLGKGPIWFDEKPGEEPPEKS